MRGIRWVALTVVFVLLGAATFTFASWMTFICFLLAFGSIGRYIWEVIPRRDKYSIESLREFEEKEVIRNLYEGVGKVAQDADTAVCPRCLTPYPSEMNTCPNCK